MKKLILSTVLAMGVLAASAQTGGSNQMGQPETNSSRDYLSSVSTNDNVRQLANQMQLNEGQYIRFRDLTRAKNEQIREVNNMYANDPAALRDRLQAVNQEYERQLAQTITQGQFTVYLATLGRAPINNPSNNLQATGYGGQSLENGAATGTSNNGGILNPDDNSGNYNLQALEELNNKKIDKKKDSRWNNRKKDKEKINRP